MDKTKRGKVHKDTKLKDIILQMQKQGEETNNNSLEHILDLDNDDNLDKVTFEEENI